MLMQFSVLHTPNQAAVMLITTIKDLLKGYTRKQVEDAHEVYHLQGMIKNLSVKDLKEWLIHR